MWHFADVNSKTTHDVVEPPISCEVQYSPLDPSKEAYCDNNGLLPYATAVLDDSDLPHMESLEIEISPTSNSVKAGRRGFVLTPPAVIGQMQVAQVCHGDESDYGSDVEYQTTGSSSDHCHQRLPHKSAPRSWIVSCPTLLLVAVLTAAVASVGGICAVGKCSAVQSEATSSLSSPQQEPIIDRTIDDPASSTAVDFIHNISLFDGTSLLPGEQHSMDWLIGKDNHHLLTTDSLDDQSQLQLRLRQRYALSTLYFHTSSSSHPWKISRGWLTSDHECYWFGVTCSRVDAFGERVVTKIDLRKNNLQGHLPIDMALLEHLKILWIGDNSLSGTLSEAIGPRWTSMTHFAINGNNMTGTIPSLLGNWSDLRLFLVSDNHFEGTLPDSIGAWTELEQFAVSKNQFVGTLPDSIGEWTRLVKLYTYMNKFTGTLPNAVGRWSSSLLHFDSSYNRLTGTLPDSIGQWSNLELFYANTNEFSGAIPTSIANWSRIDQVRLWGNDFTGTVPPGICLVSTLTSVKIDCETQLSCSCCRDCYI